MNKLVFLVPLVLIWGGIGLLFYGLGSILENVQWRKSEAERHE